MHSAAVALDLILGLAEFLVINQALRKWSGRKGWAMALFAAIVTYIPVVGGAVSCGAAIIALEWPWWLAGAAFIGGTAALAWTGGINAVLGQGSIF